MNNRLSAIAGRQLSVRVIPRARRTCVVGERGGAVVIRVAAPPVDGAANAALIDFLAKALAVPRRSITIVAGASSHNKRIQVDGLDDTSARAALLR